MPSDVEGHALALRLVQRTGFGASAALVDAAGAGDPDAVVGRLLSADPTTDPGVAATPLPELPPVPRPGPDDDATTRRQLRQTLREQQGQLEVWWLDRLVAVRDPWVEKRTLLWLGHWATSIQKVRSAAAMLGQYTTLRDAGGGDFAAMSRAMVRDPALMLWLDAAGSSASAPNENLARELMELFTLGIGSYSEQDVREAALALTGFTMEGKRSGALSPVFRERRHAPGTQTVLGVTADLSDADLVDLIVARPESARYLVTRWWGWLVSGTPPGAASIDRAVSAYGPRRDLEAMLRAVLTDPAVASPESVLVKQPVEYVAGALRSLGVRPHDLPPKEQRALLRDLRGLGQRPFAPPSVGGWPSGTAWLTSAAARVRLDLAQRLARGADLDELATAPVRDRPEFVARVLGVAAWGARTRVVLADVAADPARLVATALVAPEYVVNA